jgi:hypothetical protein|tara:strand:+ start:418 stop:834 length:417 start_codon:yes stop_codon:yes gene_type:complete
MNKTDRKRLAENIIEGDFPLPSAITCEGLVDTNALMNAEKTLLSNEVLILKGQDRKLAEAKILALSERRKELDNLYVLKKCRQLELLDIEKQNLDALEGLRAGDKSMTSSGFTNKTLIALALITFLGLGFAVYLRKRG